MNPVMWGGFVLLMIIVLVVDFVVFQRKVRAISIREALAWTSMWVTLALCFNVVVYYLYEYNWLEFAHQQTGSQAAIQFFTGYLVEYSLSVDNIFVIAMIITSFRIPLDLQHRVLYFGILGAVIMRGVMIVGGAVLIQRFTWTIYLFGGLLLLSAAKMLLVRDENVHMDRNLLVRLMRRIYPVSTQFNGTRFFTTVNGQRAMTPLMMAILLIGPTDLMFAVDSIPAVFAVTRDPFLVFTSNIFAILGLRSLYFALAWMMDRFRYLKVSLVFLLAFIGVKMLLSESDHKIETGPSLAVIGGILFVGTAASLVAGRVETERLRSPLQADLDELSMVNYQQGRKIVALLLGSSVLLVAIAMIILSGRTLWVIPAGLAILGIECAWAWMWLRGLRQTADGNRNRVQAQPENEPPVTVSSIDPPASGEFQI